MSRVRHLVLVALLLILAGCASTEQRDAVAHRNWAEHSGHLHQLQQWTASGKLALRTEERAESATLVWRQHGKDTQLQLSGPMGLSATTINSDGQKLNVRQGDKLSILDISTPDAIAENTGWDLPLHALPYWLKGIPSPDSSIQSLALDPDTDLLRNLRQDDWEVHFEQYGLFEDFMLPTKLRAERGTTSVRVVIRKWQTPPS